MFMVEVPGFYDGFDEIFFYEPVLAMFNPVANLFAKSVVEMVSEHCGQN
jgi:hypothetical protein